MPSFASESYIPKSYKPSCIHPAVIVLPLLEISRLESMNRCRAWVRASWRLKRLLPGERGAKGANMHTENTAHFPDAAIERIASLRAALDRLHIDACLIPSADPHLSEYLPGHWQGRQWLSGFNGSVGTLVVTQEFAGLWVDSRYWEQAELELRGSGIEMVKQRTGQQSALDWLAEQVIEDGTVAVDGLVMAVSSARSLRDKLKLRAIELRTDLDPLAEIWTDRPTLPEQHIYAHLAPQAVVSRTEKMSRLRKDLQARGADWHFIATVDDIAWLFNLRGSDVSYNPVFLSFALISLDQAVLFACVDKLDAALRQTLLEEGVQVRDYHEAGMALANLPATCKLLFDPARVTCGLQDRVPAGIELLEGINPTTLFKSLKTSAEVDLVRETMAHDGAALCEFFSWFESALGREPVSELTVDLHLTQARARRPGFVSLSFATIAAFNANGAMPHYRATQHSHAMIEGDGLLLIDSGGQYLSGTTDITRMIPVGNPSLEQRLDCTRVLQGMIALSRAHFPSGIASPLLDAIARAPLWADGVDYGHGTGHGVGYFLNVHEGPQVIAYQAAAAPQTAMHQGMITSIEPGTYRPGKWGVRIENLVVSTHAEKTDFGDFLCFETLTMCPIDTRCLEIEVLSLAERNWLNAYHSNVRECLAPLLDGAALKWLQVRTAEV